MSISMISPSAIPCSSDVVKIATLSFKLKIIKSSLSKLIVITLEPVVLIKSELLKNKVSDTTKEPVRTLIFTMFCFVVVSRTSPVATGTLRPSVNSNVAPLV